MTTPDQHPNPCVGNGSILAETVKYKGSKLYWRHQAEICEFYAEYGAIPAYWGDEMLDEYAAMSHRHSREKENFCD
jgi:hypothetical protein